MKRLLISALAALVMGLGLAGGSVSAGASTITLTSADFHQQPGQGAGDSTGFSLVSPTGFDVFHKFGSYNDTFRDTFTFTIKDITQLAFDVTTVNHIINLNFTLYGSTDGTTLSKLYSQKGFTGAYGDTHENVILFTDALLDVLLAQKFLVLKITGVMCSCASYNIAVTATPIPPALLLFMTALVGVGGVGFMRRRNAAGAGLAV